MKTTAITLLSFFTFVSCNGQGKQNDSVIEIKPKYEEISQTTIRIGGHVSILDYRPIADNNHLLYLRANPKEEIHKQDFYFLTINSKGDSINSYPIRFDNFFADFIELDDFYYVVTTDRRTMGGFTKDLLNKYDKNWKLIWSNRIDKPKYPTGSTVLILTNNNEILLIANECIPESSKTGISFRRYNLEGTLISENLILTKEMSNPISIIKSNDDNFYLTAELYNRQSDINSLWLMKLSQAGDTIWTKSYPHFFSRQTNLTRNGDLIFYGSNYSQSDERKTHHHYLKIIVLDRKGNLKWQKEIKQNYYERPGNFLETKDGNYLFASTITPIKDKGSRAYLFELDSNGDLTFERKFEYPVGINSVPFIFRTEGQITMVGQKWIGKFGEPFKDIIHITKLTE